MKHLLCAVTLLLSIEISAEAGLREAAPVAADFADPLSALAAGQLREAEEGFRSITRQYPRHPRAWMELAKCLDIQSRHAEANSAYTHAISHYREQVRYFPHDVDSWHGLIQAMCRIGQGKESEEILAEGLRQNPGAPRLLAMRPDPNALVHREYRPTGPLQAELTEIDLPDVRLPSAWDRVNPLMAKLTQIRRPDARAILERRGLKFPAGATAVYIARSNRLIVRNTPAAHSTLDQLLAEE